MVQSNLPPESQQWGREIEGRLRTLEIATQSAGSLARSNQNTLASVQRAVRSLDDQQQLLSVNASSVHLESKVYSSTGATVETFEFSPPPEARGSIVVFVSSTAGGTGGGGGMGAIGGVFHLAAIDVEGTNSYSISVADNGKFDGDPTGSSGDNFSRVIDLENWGPDTMFELRVGVDYYTSPAKAQFFIDILPRYTSLEGSI